MDELTAYESAASDDEASNHTSAHDELAHSIGTPPPPFVSPYIGENVQSCVTSHRPLMHVFIPVSGNLVENFVKRLMGLSRLQLVGKTIKASFCQHDSFHISISRPCVIELSRIPQVLAALKGELSNQSAASVLLEEFVIALLSQTNSRLFIAATVSFESAVNIVLPLIRCVDRAFARLSLPLFYENPLPHMSFASTSTTAVKESFPDPLATPANTVPTIEVHAGSVICEIGHRQFSFPLRASQH